MPAYFRLSAWHKCEYQRCAKNAEGQAFNTYNAPIGWYCERHGAEVVKNFNARATVQQPGPTASG